MTPQCFLAVCSLPAGGSDGPAALREALGQAFPSAQAAPYLERLAADPPSRAVRRLSAFALLPPLLAAAGIRSDTLYPARDSRGRPVLLLTGSGAPLRTADFNLSHTETRAACALLTGGGRIGLDIEEPIPRERAAKLLRRYASEREREDAAAARWPWEGFTRLWTIREAIVKQSGRGGPWLPDASSRSPDLAVLSGHLPDGGTSVSVCLPDEWRGRSPRIVMPSLDVVWDEWT